jgi:hypothetical protein
MNKIKKPQYRPSPIYMTLIEYGTSDKKKIRQIKTNLMVRDFILIGITIVFLITTFLGD